MSCRSGDADRALYPTVRGRRWVPKGDGTDVGGSGSRGVGESLMLARITQSIHLRYQSPPQPFNPKGFHAAVSSPSCGPLAPGEEETAPVPKDMTLTPELIGAIKSGTGRLYLSGEVTLGDWPGSLDAWISMLIWDSRLDQTRCGALSASSSQSSLFRAIVVAVTV